MLVGLDLVPWDTHRDAYGPATEVPGLIRGVASALPEVRQDAIGKLAMSLCHGSSVSEATAVAVPFLWELAASPAVRERHRVVALLADVARASGAPDDVGKVRASIWKELPRALALLEDEDVLVRVAAAYLLASAASTASAEAPQGALSSVRDALCARRAAETDERAASGLAFALGWLAAGGDAAAAAELKAMMEHPSRDVRLAAAVAIGEAKLEAPPERASVVLQTALESAEPKACWQGEPWGRGPLPMRLLDALRALGGELPLPTVRAVFAKSSSYSADALEPTMRAVFSQRTAELTPMQRELLEVLADNTAFWRGVSNGALLLTRLGLPDSRQELRRMLGWSPPPSAATDEAEARAVLQRTLGDRDPLDVTEIDLSHVATDAVVVLLSLECPNLVKLTLQDCEISDGAWAAFAGFSQLREAWLAQSGVTDQGLANVARARSLEILGLGPCSVTDDGLTDLASLGALRELLVHSPDVRGAGVKHLATLPLTRLHLGAAVDDACLAPLAALTGLGSLALRGRALRGQGIALLRSMRSLATLDLRDTGFCDDSAAELVPLEALTSLNLGSTTLTDAAVPALSRLRGLTWLGLGQTRVTAEGRGRLREALPGCRVLPEGEPGGSAGTTP